MFHSKRRFQPLGGAFCAGWALLACGCSLPPQPMYDYGQGTVNRQAGTSGASAANPAAPGADAAMLLAGRGGSESLDAGHGVAAGSGAKSLDAGQAGRHESTANDTDAEAPIAAGLTIPTGEGAIHGKQLGKSRVFLGIPYAQPPVGMLRWRAPQPPAAHAGVLETTDYAHICPQNLPIVGWDGRSDENCLFLNVWTPDPAPSKPLPVMVYLHGGAYQLGSGGDQYDGQKLSEAQNIVTVTLNYRLGVLGFLAHPALTAESGTSGSGNYGLLDQQRALAWLRDNISVTSSAMPTA